MQNPLFENIWVSCYPNTREDTKKIVNGMMGDFFVSKGFTYNKSRNLYYRIFNEEIIQAFSYRYEDNWFWTPYFTIVPLCEGNGLNWFLFTGGDISSQVMAYDPLWYLYNHEGPVNLRNRRTPQPCIFRPTREECVKYVMEIIKTHIFPLADELTSMEKYFSFILNPKQYPIGASGYTCLLIVGRYATQVEWEAYEQEKTSFLNGIWGKNSSNLTEWNNACSLIYSCRASGSWEPLDEMINGFAEQNLAILKARGKRPPKAFKGTAKEWQVLRHFGTEAEMAYSGMIENAPPELIKAIRNGEMGEEAKASLPKRPEWMDEEEEEEEEGTGEGTGE